MDSELDELQRRLQEMVTADARKVYSEKVLDHAMNPRNVGEIRDADGYGSALGICSDSMEIWLRVRDDVVTDARFWTDGCATTIASGSAITELVKGKTVVDALALTPKDVLAALDGLPADSEHCATLAANALHQAIQEYLALKNDPWRRPYRQY